MVNDPFGSSHDSSTSSSPPLITRSRRVLKRRADILDDDSDDIITSPAERGRRRATMQNEHDRNGDYNASPRKRRLFSSAVNIKQHGQPRETLRRFASSQDLEDLEEDLDALPKSGILDSRTRGKNAPLSNKKSKMQKQLERLKLRRAGQLSRSSSSSERDAETGASRGIYDTESDDELRLTGSLSDDDQKGNEITETTVRPASLDVNGDWDDDFVVDDEDILGVPPDQTAAVLSIPIEFTRHANKRPKEYFRDAVEWMVHNKLDPAFDRHDDLYKMAFRRLEDQVKGYASSKFMSTKWSSAFTRAIKSRPIFSAVENIQLDHNCDACNLSGHPASWQVQLDGKPYHCDSLDEVTDSEGSASEDDERKSFNSQGLSLPDTDVEWFLGSSCKHNAEMAHALTHWRYHLNDWVVDYLKERGYTTRDGILERENWSRRKRSQYADDVVDAMEQDGEIRALFRDFEINLDAARDSKVIIKESNSVKCS
ncbi:MAG: hypothetical protein M1819_005133 [Sarea resinae]|nr:MAG: hypothetical protein M1819_005133 [Sarea resinae]